MALNVLVQYGAQLDFVPGPTVQSSSFQDHVESSIQQVAVPRTLSRIVGEHDFWVFGTWSLTETLNMARIKADPRSLSEVTWFIGGLWAELFHWL